MAFIQVSDCIPSQSQPQMSVQSINRSQDSKKIGSTLVGIESMARKQSLVILPIGTVMPSSMKAIMGITTSPTFRSNFTLSVVQCRTVTSWGNVVLFFERLYQGRSLYQTLKSTHSELANERANSRGGQPRRQRKFGERNLRRLRCELIFVSLEDL